jgi:hypothetical protein
MKRQTAMRMLLAGFAATILLAGCGGGGGGGTSQGVGPAPSGPVSVLAWTPPTTYNDNVTLVPERDLVYYEVYVRGDLNFTDGDLPVAEFPAVEGGVPITEFTLELIRSLPAGNVLYVSMRAVGVDQQKSAFMAPLTWDRT